MNFSFPKEGDKDDEFNSASCGEGMPMLSDSQNVKDSFNESDDAQDAKKSTMMKFLQGIKQVTKTNRNNSLSKLPHNGLHRESIV